jgi:hypothetical protein
MYLPDRERLERLYAKLGTGVRESVELAAQRQVRNWLEAHPGSNDLGLLKEMLSIAVFHELLSISDSVEFARECEHAFSISCMAGFQPFVPGEDVKPNPGADRNGRPA